MNRIEMLHEELKARIEIVQLQKRKKTLYQYLQEIDELLDNALLEGYDERIIKGMRKDYEGTKRELDIVKGKIYNTIASLNIDMHDTPEDPHSAEITLVVKVEI